MTLALILASEPLATIGARSLVVVLALALWFLTQSLISTRSPGSRAQNAGGIDDGVHRLTARINQHLGTHTGHATALLISSSLVIDALGCWLIASAIFGSTIRPFLGMIMLFGLRQICQAFCPLPPPAGMIWRKTGFPTILVTYGVSNDLFFSGHTAIAVYGAAVLATDFGPWGAALGSLIAAFEIGAVLVLRAHYTMDVFTGAIAALYVHHLAALWAPAIDAAIAGAISFAQH